MSARLKTNMKTFKTNLEAMKKRTQAEQRAVLMTGVSAYATSAQKHTPPALGKASIPSTYYQDGVDSQDAAGGAAKGRRIIIDLLEMVRRPSGKYSRYLRQYGKKLQEGFQYAVLIKHPGKKMIVKFVKNASQAKRYARISYRGLYRAAWGMNFAVFGSSAPPPVFDKYLKKRPDLERVRNLNRISFKGGKGLQSVTIENNAVPNGTFTSDDNAKRAARFAMQDRMNALFAKRVTI